MTSPILYAGASPFGLDVRTRANVRDAVRRFHVRESAPTLERPAQRTAVREATPGGATPAGTGRMALRLISAGWSLNGNLYPAEVLRRDGPAAWPAGTRAYVDHASDAEEEAHPSGSVKNLAAVLTSDAHWDEASQSLIAEARLFEPWRGPLSQMAEAGAIGMSIRAWVTGEHGERDGREGFIVESIPQGRSVDFVTVPAAGGAVISVLEAVGQPVQEAASLGGWLESRLHLALTQYADDMYGNGQLTRDERIVLSNAIGDGLAAWTARVEQGAPQLFTRDRWSDAPEPEPAAPESSPNGFTDEQAAPEAADASETSTPDRDSGADDQASDAGSDTTPPSAEESEEPVSGTETGAPPEQAGPATAPDVATTTAPATEAVAVVQPSQEAMTAAITAAVEAATRPLTEQIAQMAARESARDGEARAARNRATATEAVTQALTAAEHADVAASIRGRVAARVAAGVPTTAEGAVNDTALGELITTVIADEATHVRRERANALAEAGVGLPYGMGGAPAQDDPDDGLEAELTNLFGSLGMSESAVKIAAEGRR